MKVVKEIVEGRWNTFPRKRVAYVDVLYDGMSMVL